MLFSSVHYLLFLLIVILFYYSLPFKFRWVVLLASSIYFYALFVPYFIAVLGLTVVITYISAIFIEKTVNKKRILLISSVILLTVILVFFKYYEPITLFLASLFPRAAFKLNPFVIIVLPVGLSFHTFQNISYLVEVKRGNYKAERNFGIYSLYVFFFPQVVAGPIERPKSLLSQLRNNVTFDIESFKSGILLFTYGLFKKVVIADRLALVVDGAFSDPASQSGSALLLAAVFYSFQIYCDFSGYTDMALGSARMLGYNLTENFNRPYISKSITEFWTRWHISLSTWLRDYLFLPIAFKVLKIAKKKILNIKPEIWSYISATLITMFIAGVWHGETSGFVLWGLLHGIYLVISFIKGRLYKKYKFTSGKFIFGSQLQILVTFMLVSLAWVLFRVPDVADAMIVFEKIFSATLFTIPQTAMNINELVLSITLIVLLLLKEKYINLFPRFSNFYFVIILTLMASVCYLFGVYSQRQFIYFQF